MILKLFENPVHEVCLNIPVKYLYKNKLRLHIRYYNKRLHVITLAEGPVQPQ